MKIDISVIIPTYRRPEKLEKTLKSLKHQTYKNFEIIVVDDNGNDIEEQHSTEKKIRELNFTNLKYYCLDKNYGAPYARNYGASKSSCKYLAFLDDDDYWAPSKLEEQISFSNKKTNFSFCFCKQVLVFKGKEKRYSNWIYRGGIQNKLRQGNCIGSSSNPLIVRAEFLKSRGFDLNLPSCQDWDLWYRLSKQAAPIYINKVLVKIDRSPSERISSNKLKVLLGHLMLFDKIKSDTKRKGSALLIFRIKILKHLLSFLR